MLLANLLIGYHEQWRLQESIAGALDATWTTVIEPYARRLRAALAGRLRRLLTRHMLKMTTPAGSLNVAQDVPPLPDGRMFPAALERVTLPDLRRLLARIDRTPDTTRGSAARDWASFADRMNYVADMFRAQQQARPLWWSPFTVAQVRALQRGHHPTGPL